MKNLFLVLWITFAPFLADAKEHVKKNMQNFFSQFDVHANTTKSDVVDGQLGGYATGGGAVVRNSVVNTKIVNMNLPKIDAGCGGIDIYSGGISFISSDRLVETLKKVATNSVGYAALLGMETLSPVTANLVKQLQSWANQINLASINSCETASLLVGGLVPRNSEASQHICRHLGSKEGLFHDYVSSRHQCGIESVKEENLNEFKNKYPGVLVDEYNLAWEATRELAIRKNDPDLGKLLMSLIGTFILRRENRETVMEIYPPQLKNENFFRAIINGGAPKILTCKEKGEKFVNTKCLFVEEIEHIISYSDSWKGRVFVKLSEIQRKILDDEELSQEDIDFVALCDTPVIRIINITNAYRKNLCPIEISQLSDWVAQDLLCKSLREAINNVRVYAFQLKRSEMYVSDIDDYLKQLDDLHSVIRDYESKNSDSIHKKLKMNELLDILESKMQSEIEL
jgi:conjugative transfer pilus assembly protein TraH